ncbi:hypothetical protein J6G99_00875 [bacterium]|nr:hypothetical protein [bacterium]
MAGIGQARMYEIQQQNIQAFKSKVESGQINKDSTFVIKRYDKISDTVANILLAKGITNPTTEQIQEVKSQLLSNSDISGTIKAKNKGDMDLYFLKEGKSIDMSKIHVTGETNQEALSELQDQLAQGQSNNGSLTDVSKPEVPKETLQLSEEDSQKLQNDIFKNQISNMSKKQLKQFAENSNDLNKLKMISEELGSRGKDHSKSIVDKKINLLEAQQDKSQQAKADTSVQQQPETVNPKEHGVLNRQADVGSAVVKPEQAETTIIHTPPSSPTISSQTKSKSLNDQQLKEYLDNDSSYQAYSKKFDDMDKRMAELENKAGIDRNKRADLNIFNLSSEEQKEYSSLSLQYRSLKNDLEDYRNNMRNWQNDKKFVNVIASINNYTQEWTNVETITLKNGQHAYKSDQGVFYPGPNGRLTLGSRPVPKELLE